MICPNCGHGNWGGDPYDTGCRRCGYDPEDEDHQANADEVADNKRRDRRCDGNLPKMQP